jgi:hypothetical protein
MWCGRLGPHLNDFDLVFLADEGIERSDDAVSGNADEIGHALANQVLRNDLAAGESHGGFS